MSESVVGGREEADIKGEMFLRQWRGFICTQKLPLRAYSSSQGATTDSTLLQSIIKSDEPGELWKLLKPMDDDAICDTMW